MYVREKVYELVISLDFVLWILFVYTYSGNLFWFFNYLLLWLEIF